MTGRILLVRHTAVALRWRGRCYGITDVGLSRAGRRAATALAAELTRRQPTKVIHSGLRRTSWLADVVAQATDSIATIDSNWRERDFGQWEERSWLAIWRETGSAMDGMMTDPTGYRPGGGETSQELASRTLKAAQALPLSGTILVVTHGGPIASLLSIVSGRSLRDAVTFIPPVGSVTELPRSALPSPDTGSRT